MATRLPGSRRTREELTTLIEGRLSTASAKDELVKLATSLIVEEALEGEASDALGRAQPGGQTAGGRLAGVQGSRAGGLSGAEPSDCARARGRHRRGV